MDRIGEWSMKRWLSYRGVVEVTSLSESTIRRLIAEGRFPRAVEATEGRKVFDGAAVEAAMEALLASRQRPTSPQPPEGA